MSESLSFVYFPAAVLLGALHALEPGHAKALTASYLIGIRGTKKDSVLLGLSAATTHSIVVILISATGLWLGSEAFTGEATHWLEMGSGFIAIAVGLWMLYRRLFIKRGNGHHHHAEPVLVKGTVLNGVLEIVETPLGERFKFKSNDSLRALALTVVIERTAGEEILNLAQSPIDPLVYLSSAAPDEPHEFKASLVLPGSDKFSFEIHEPDDHSHAHLDDEAHAKAHAVALPDYVKQGERPTSLEIIGFGAAGGMIPCPASITVMLLALSTGQAAMGVFTVLGFSLGLAIALVGVGLIVVTGLSKLADTGRFAWVTRQAPVISACLVVASGIAALTIVRVH